MLRYWIWLSSREGICRQKKLMLLEKFGSPEAVYMLDANVLQSEAHLSEKESRSFADKSLSSAERILASCDKKRISVLTYTDTAYPSRLKNISDPPLVLYYEGHFPNIDTSAVIAMVGTRKASGYGQKNAYDLGYQLSRCGAVIVSGSAAGIDTMSLKGALTGGMPVISVLGNGTDVVYPQSNRLLYEDIRQNGTLLSEYPPGTPPLPMHFPVRNRIIAGLAVGVVVVEAPRQSGAMITAEYALEQGKDVFAVPANLGNDFYKGNFQLLKEGAILVENGADILKEYVGIYPVSGGRIEADFHVSEDQTAPEKGAESPRQKKKDVDRGSEPNYIDLSEILSRVSQEGALILKALEHGALHVDDLVTATGMPASRILSSITILEIKRFVVRQPGQRFSLSENIRTRERNE